MSSATISLPDRVDTEWTNSYNYNDIDLTRIIIIWIVGSIIILAEVPTTMYDRFGSYQLAYSIQHILFQRSDTHGEQSSLYCCK